jgi:hypothetical protein
MTTNSDRFKYFDPQDPFALIPTPWGEMEAWRASTMATGTMGMLQNVYDMVRADSAAQAARADATEARNALIQHLCEKVEEFQRRFDDHEARLAAAEDARRADQAHAREFAEEPVTLPPDLQEYQTENPPAEIGDVSKEPEPSLNEQDNTGDRTDDNTGDLPEEIQLPKPLSEPEPEPKGTVFPQPISISLNEE